MTFTRPSRLSVLICGGGIAGATLACLLARAGHHTTVVERDRTARSSGNPVPAALAHYEATHRPVTARGQRAAPFASHLLVPASATGITLRNRALRLAHGISPMSRSWR